MKLNKLLLRKGYTNIKLKKINTNHFELKGTINGVNGRFILDTGASNSCIDIFLGDKFKLNVEDSETKAAGAGAIDIETKISSKNKLKLKGWSYYNCPLVLIDLAHVNTALTEHKADPVDGIIGADILEKGNAIIDYKNKLLYLKKLIYKY